MDSWSNQEALNKALNIYRAAMRSFIISRLKQIPGTDLESTVTSSFHWSPPRVDEIRRKLFQTDRNIESVIDINDFPHLVNRNWEDAFETRLNDDKIFRNQLWLIVECRNYGAHLGDVDIESEFTRAHLFLIADVLGKINRSDAKCKVEAIRDDLFFDDTAEHLAEVEERLTKVESEKHECEKSKVVLSQQIVDNALKIKNTSEQLKASQTENAKYKKDLAGAEKRVLGGGDSERRLQKTS